MKFDKIVGGIFEKKASLLTSSSNSNVLFAKNGETAHINGLQNIPLKNDTVQFQKFGKHKIPRYIYHITDRESYEKILSDGYIKPTFEQLFGNGIFAIELSNLFKVWSKTNILPYDETLLVRLLKHVCRGKKDNLVILKISTEKIDQSKLVIRSQNRMFTALMTVFQERERLADIIIQKVHSTAGFKNRRGLIREGIRIMTPEKRFAHLTKGTPAQFSNLFKQRKEAIEYIYKDPIAVADTEKLCEMNIKESVKNNMQSIKNLFAQVLKGKPEEKALKEWAG